MPRSIKPTQKEIRKVCEEQKAAGYLYICVHGANGKELVQRCGPVNREFFQKHIEPLLGPEPWVCWQHATGRETPDEHRVFTNGNEYFVAVSEFHASEVARHHSDKMGLDWPEESFAFHRVPDSEVLTHVNWGELHPGDPQEKTMTAKEWAMSQPIGLLMSEDY